MSKDTVADEMTERMTPMKLPAGVAISTAKILPGEAGPVRPEPKSTFTKMPVMPPPIMATMSSGFISTYGK